jgi:drug/metabolite transporter (DMT)-like permease
MARRRGRFTTFIVLGVLALAAYGGYMIWNKREVQKRVDQVERSVKAAKTAW